MKPASDRAPATALGLFQRTDRHLQRVCERAYPTHFGGEQHCQQDNCHDPIAWDPAIALTASKSITFFDIQAGVTFVVARSLLGMLIN